jgi:hypothetical protein
MARRTKLTPEVQHHIVTAIKTGATYEVAAQFGGITRATLWLWLKKGQEQSRGIYRTFFDTFKKAEAQSCVRSLAIVHQAANEGSWQAAAVQVNIETTGSVSNMSVVELVDQVKDRQRLLGIVDGPIIDLDEE